MKRRSLAVCIIGIVSVMLFAGCGSVNASTDTRIHENAGEVSESTAEEEPEKEPSEEEHAKEPAGDTDPGKADEATDADTQDSGKDTEIDAETEENAFDGGPDWVSLAHQSSCRQDPQTV